MKVMECNRTKEDVEAKIARWTELKVRVANLSSQSIVTCPERETKHFVLPIYAAKGTRVWEVWFTEQELKKIFDDFNEMLGGKYIWMTQDEIAALASATKAAMK